MQYAAQSVLLFKLEENYCAIQTMLCVYIYIPDDIDNASNTKDSDENKTFQQQIMLLDMNEILFNANKFLCIKLYR